ncbi:gastrin-releasing peptide receptor [Petromyzon marinus]|uniref:Gastrin-releasing peptide receptor-like n=1 Tax=Petromyzon marinus TaxID=7757 RepID=A0AAJ7U2R7_PETMA|nr:gastrin-releasing peptide receptor-like [Petromyzon marinus]XP_032828640.1 gastrin-releasing peptide receptor-like [Petromyzon marinus]XP_032828641.1 gastrin-releasing peptide receptor-like [Petromyzon marinus]XP_032828642.1 gastrin-releasing peptide receptor-like [Petromyzon marinus]
MEDSPPPWVILSIMLPIFGLIMLLGLLGNSALIRYVLTQKPRQGNASDVHLVSMAIGDLMVLVTCVPSGAISFFYDSWMFGRLGCKLLPFLQLTSLGISVFTLVALSADRYRAIVRPMDEPRHGRFSSTWFTVLCIWLGSIALATPDSVLADVVPLPFTLLALNASSNTTVAVTTTSMVCVPFPHNGTAAMRAHAVAVSCVYFVAPLTLITVFYCFISAELLGSAGRVPGNNAARQVSSRRRLAKTVLLLVALFALCSLPNHALQLYRVFRDQSQPDLSPTHKAFFLLSRALIFANSCVNPLALCAVSSGFRGHLRQTLCERPAARPPLLACCERGGPAPLRRGHSATLGTSSRVTGSTRLTMQSVNAVGGGHGHAKAYGPAAGIDVDT